MIMATQHKNPSHMESGKKATEQKGPQQGSQGSHANQSGSGHQQGERRYPLEQTEQGKDVKRVEAGKKAADSRSHDDFVEATKKGGQQSHSGGGRHAAG